VTQAGRRDPAQKTFRRLCTQFCGIHHFCGGAQSVKCFQLTAYGAVFALTPTSTVTHPTLPFGPLASIR
jgi:hypothetical protein